MAEVKNKHGIWQGRFQIIHKGHEWVFLNILSRYEKKCIAIVNPNPHKPPNEHFERFDSEFNPFSYFDRMLLWKKILESHNVSAMLFPVWHPRQSVALENYILPKKREWIIPILNEEELYKIRDLHAKGELTYSDFSMPTDIQGISATSIRMMFDRNDINYKTFLPESISDLMYSIYKNGDSNEYVVVPIIEERFNADEIIQACRSINISSYDYVIFGVNVPIKNSETWWFENAAQDSYLTYFERYSFIKNVMDELKITKYLVTPLFFRDGLYCDEESEPFLPVNRTWFLDRSDIDSVIVSNFFKYLAKEEEVVNINCKRDDYGCEYYSSFVSTLIAQANEHIITHKKVKPLYTHFDNLKLDNSDMCLKINPKK